MSSSACFSAFLVSSFPFALGLSVRMDFPRLIDLEPEPAGQEDPLAGAWPVMSAFIQAKLMSRFLLTWAAATHCPTFLNPEQACWAGIPVSVCSLLDNLLFFESWSLTVLSCGALLLPAFMFPWLAVPILPPVPWPCCASANPEFSRTASASIKVFMDFIRMSSVTFFLSQILRILYCRRFLRARYPTLTPTLNETEFNA